MVDSTIPKQSFAEDVSILWRHDIFLAGSTGHPMPTIPPFDPNTPCKDKVCFANHCYQLGFPYITSSELSTARHLCSNGHLAVFASNMSKPNTYDFLQLCEVFEDTCVARVLVCVWQNAFYVHCFSLCPWGEASWDVGQTTFNAWPSRHDTNFVVTGENGNCHIDEKVGIMTTLGFQTALENTYMPVWKGDAIRTRISVLSCLA